MKTKIALALCCSLVLFKNKMISQNSMAFGLSSQVAANGYGVEYVPSLIFAHGQNVLNIGASIPKGKARFDGLQVKYERTVTGEAVQDSATCLELFFFANAAYYHNASLGIQCSQRENMVNPDLSVAQLRSMKFNSLELYTGAGLRIPFLHRFKWVNYVGVGYYNSLTRCCKLYRDPTGLGLFLSTGLSVTIK